jgi:hypothetical protein
MIGLTLEGQRWLLRTWKTVGACAQPGLLLIVGLHDEPVLGAQQAHDLQRMVCLPDSRFAAEVPFFSDNEVSDAVRRGLEHAGITPHEVCDEQVERFERGFLGTRQELERVFGMLGEKLSLIAIPIEVLVVKLDPVGQGCFSQTCCIPG